MFYSPTKCLSIKGHSYIGKVNWQIPIFDEEELNARSYCLRFGSWWFKRWRRGVGDSLK